MSFKKGIMYVILKGYNVWHSKRACTYRVKNNIKRHWLGSNGLCLWMMNWNAPG